MLKANSVARYVLRYKSKSQNVFSIEELCSESNKLSCIAKMQTILPNMSKAKGPHKHAAVLIPVVFSRDDNELSLLYTLRSSNLKKHTGQVSFPGSYCITMAVRILFFLIQIRTTMIQFPGGIRDKDDLSYIECALRETEEEIGIKREQITVWGETKLCYTASGPAIMPVVGSIENYDPASLRINTQEVARVFTIPISLLCRSKRHTQFKSNYSIPAFACPGTAERVWGISAVITDRFLRSLLPPEMYENRIKFILKYK